MTKPVLTQLAGRYISILLVLFLGTSGLHSQVSYLCSYDDSLQPGTVEFRITIFGDGPGETWSLENISNLYSNIDPDILIDDGFVIPEDPMEPGVYRVTGFAYDGIMPFATVVQEGGMTIDMNMITCMSPTTEIIGDMDICAGGTATLTVSVSNPNILAGSVSWSAMGPVVSSNMYGVDDLMYDVSWSQPGTYLVSVSGETINGFTFSDNAVVTVFDIAEDYVIEGPMYLCTENNENVIYNVNIPDSVAVSWSAVPPVDMITPLTGSGAAVSVTFPDSPGLYTLYIENQDPDGCTISGVFKPVQVVDVIDTVSVTGDVFVCLGDTESYSVDDSYNDVSWMVTPGDPPGSGGFIMDPMSGSGSNIMIQYTEAGSYEISVSGTNDDGCPFESSINVTVPGDSIGSLACNNSVNVSLNNTCILELFPDMILEGEYNQNEAYTLTIQDASTGEVLEDNMLTQDMLGHTFIVTVVQECGGNSCWGTVVVEDKSVTQLPPICPDSESTTCFEFAETPHLFGFPDFDEDVIINYRPARDDFIVSGFDNCSDVILSYVDVNVSSDECSDPQHIVRTWTAVDINNGLSTSCVVDIFIGLVDKSSIMWPPNWDSGLDDDAPGDPDTDNTFGSLDACDLNNPPQLFCNSWLNNLDANGNPSPTCTGYPSGLVCSNLQLIGYKDQTISICGNARKILRKWSVWDACTNEDVMYTQIITIMDNDDPICVAPEDGSYFTDTHECGADVILDPPVVTNECAGWTYRVQYKTGNYNDGLPETFTDANLTYDPVTNRYTINDLAFDSDSLYVRYIVTDVCGNRTDDCFGCFELLDDEQPIPACDLNTSIALNDDGLAYAGPNTFDDHSWDNCGIYTRVIQRMDQRCDCFERKLDFMYKLGEFNGHYYYLSKGRFDGTKAFNYAEALDGYIAVINSAEENEWLRDAANDFISDPYYIGLRGSSFVNLQWIGAASSYNYSSQWDSSEPFPDENFRKGDVFTVVNEDGTWEAERQSGLEAYYVIEFDTRCGWTQKEVFCCADLGEETMVSMKVIDIQGNDNFCMVNVDVQDFTPPRIVCPDNVTIDCDTPYDLDDLSAYGSATARDICDVSLSADPGVFIPGSCGEGQIVRTFRATDGANESVCNQIITIENIEVFGYNDIIWPANELVTDICSLEDYDPGSNVPRWNENRFKCSSIIYTYDDLLFTIVQDACQKLVRTWTVVDWCNPSQQFTYEQVIKLMNTNPPVLSAGSCSTLSVPDGVVVGPCLVQVDDVTASVVAGSMTCNDHIDWRYTVDYNDNGSIDQTGASADASGPYPYGTHRLTWTATDACGNSSTCDKLIIVDDNKAPTPYCHGEIVIPVNTEEGVEIWASDLDIGSQDDCPANPVTLSFDENLLITSATVSCADIPDSANVGYVKLNLWVWDNANPAIANKSYCTVTIQVQDNAGVCGSNKPGSIAGHIMTESYEMIEEVELEMISGTPGVSGDMMSMDGSYAFSNVPMYEDYIVRAAKNDDYLNGVSTLDLLIIQRHILNVERLDSPYKLIAADINSSRDISAIDLIELRKLILGIYKELPENNSWRFIDENFTFNDPKYPWPFDESIDISDLDSDIADANFMGVKIGDVNGSVKSSDAGQKNHTEKSIYNIDIVQDVTEKGNTRLRFVAGANADLAGMQFELNFDPERSALIAAIPRRLPIEQSHVGWDSANKGRLPFSWTHPSAIQVAEGDILMEFLFDGVHTEVLTHVDTRVLEPEMYTETDQALKVHSLQFMNVGGGTRPFELFQNAPNPFSEASYIGFNLPEASRVKLVISDAGGRIVYSGEEYYPVGYNEWIIHKDVLNTSGILYYKLSTATHSSTRKMIVLR